MSRAAPPSPAARLAQARADAAPLLAAGNAAGAEALLRAACAAVQPPQPADPHAAALAAALGAALNDWGVALLTLQRPADAAGPLAQAAALAPHLPDLHGRLCTALLSAGEQPLAEEAARRGLALHQGDRRLTIALAVSLSEQGRADEAATILEAALRLAPADPAPPGHVPPAPATLHELHAASLNYVWPPEARRIRAAARAHGAALAAFLPSAAAASPPPPPAAARAALRVGLLSADLRDHSVARFVLPLLEHAQSAGLDLVVLSTTDRPDATTASLRAAAHQGGAAWREPRGLDDPTLAAAIAAERLDVLVECHGLTAGHRLAALAHRPAPRIVTWLGYPASTGCPWVDARLVDAATDPPDAEPAGTERLLRIDGCFLCFAPPPSSVPIPAATPRPAGAPPVFGSFNAAAKLTTMTLRLWARLLRAVPGSALAIKCWELQSAGARAAFARRLERAGCDPARVRFLPYAPSRAAHLAAQLGIDVALDPIPYNGTTTTCDALSMGVPVVAMQGVLHAGRVGASLLRHAGFHAWVAPDQDAYVKIASALADPNSRPPRDHVRARFLASPVCDGPGFARRWAAALRLL